MDRLRIQGDDEVSGSKKNLVPIQHSSIELLEDEYQVSSGRSILQGDSSGLCNRIGLYRLRKTLIEACFVTGHDFSRAARRT
jgi:hypothetical protein